MATGQNTSGSGRCQLQERTHHPRARRHGRASKCERPLPPLSFSRRGPSRTPRLRQSTWGQGPVKDPLVRSSSTCEWLTGVMWPRLLAWLWQVCGRALLRGGVLQARLAVLARHGRGQRLLHFGVLRGGVHLRANVPAKFVWKFFVRDRPCSAHDLLQPQDPPLSEPCLLCAELAKVAAYRGLCPPRSAS